MSAKTNSKDIALRFLQAFWDGEPDRAFELCAEDAQWTFQKSLRSPRYASIPDAVDWLNAALMTGFDADSGYSVEVHHTIGEGEEAAIEYSATGKTVRGEIYANNYVVRFTVRDGQIVSVRPYFDTYYVHQRLAALEPLAED
jgi:ketosteroid isomerase-like protein